MNIYKVRYFHDDSNNTKQGTPVEKRTVPEAQQKKNDSQKNYDLNTPLKGKDIQKKPDIPTGMVRHSDIYRTDEKTEELLKKALEDLNNISKRKSLRLRSPDTPLNKPQETKLQKTGNYVNERFQKETLNKKVILPNLKKENYFSKRSEGLLDTRTPPSGERSLNASLKKHLETGIDQQKKSSINIKSSLGLNIPIDTTGINFSKEKNQYSSKISVKNVPSIYKHSIKKEKVDYSIETKKDFRLLQKKHGFSMHKKDMHDRFRKKNQFFMKNPVRDIELDPRIKLLPLANLKKKLKSKTYR